MSPGHVHHYFGTRAEIVDALIKLVLERTMARFESHLEKSGLVAALLSEVKRETKGSRLLLELFAESARNPRLAKRLQQHSRQMTALVAARVRDGQAQGQFDASMDADETACVLLAVVDGAKAASLRDPTRRSALTAKLMDKLIARFVAPQTGRRQGTTRH